MFLLAVACASLFSKSDSLGITAFAAGSSISEAELAELLAYDFSAGMAAYERVNVSSPAALRFRSQPRSGVMKAELTEMDEQILSFYDLKDRGPSHWVNAVSAVISSYRRDGVLPQSGVHLFPELLTREGYADFMALAPAERFARYSWGVNFATKRFHDSYTDPQWRPGAWYFYAAGDDDTVRIDGSPVSMQLVSREPGSRSAGYRLFGSAPGDVLRENVASAGPPHAAKPAAFVASAGGKAPVSKRLPVGPLAPCDCDG